MNPRPRFTRRTGGALLGTTALVVAGAVVIPSASAATTRHAYPGSVPAFVATADDTESAPADTTVEGEVYLPLRDPVGARALASAVSTPGNAKYGQYISPEQWIDTYSPTQKTFNKVKKYLTDSGYTIFATPQSRQFIVFRGPASASSAAFGTTIHTYSVGGKTLTAPATAASLPSSVSDAVSGVVLGDSREAATRPSHVVQPGSARTATSSRTVTPKATTAAPQCSTYFGENTATVPSAYGRTTFPTNICGYLPGQLRSSAGLNKTINSGYDGTGQTVAIVDAYASPTIVQDTNDYMTQVGSPLLTRYKQLTPTQPYQDYTACGGSAGWQTEQTLDVQSSHSVAPGAKLLYVGGFNCGGGLDIALSRILDGHLSSIVSNSYGYEGEMVPDDLVAGQENSHIQAAAEGIGLYFSSGDEGDTAADTGSAQPDYPASSPWVTAVGGTSLAIKADGTYGFETGWGSTRDQIVNGAYAQPLPGTFVFGSGGGTSSLFDQPAYQKGIVPASLSTGSDGTPSRVVPDVADLADPYTGFQIEYRPITNDQTQQTGPLTTATYGGTSLASPLVAAKAALISQLTGRQLGFANPLIYSTAKQSPSAFRDVQPPSSTVAVYAKSASTGKVYLVTLDRDSSLATTTGYDNVTGLGSLNVPAIRQILAGN